jgi:hypothetical protein
VKEKVEDAKDEDQVKKDHPTINIDAMLKSIGLADSIPKLKENEITETDVFFELDEGKLIELLDIKTEGKKYRFKEKIKEVKEKHEKAKAERQLAEDVSEIVSETFEKLQKKATIIF